MLPLLFSSAKFKSSHNYRQWQRPKSNCQSTDASATVEAPRPKQFGDEKTRATWRPSQRVVARAAAEVETRAEKSHFKSKSGTPSRFGAGIYTPIRVLFVEIHCMDLVLSTRRTRPQRLKLASPSRLAAVVMFFTWIVFSAG